jgi:hypothetical protein
MYYGNLGSAETMYFNEVLKSYGIWQGIGKTVKLTLQPQMLVHIHSEMRLTCYGCLAHNGRS